MIFSPTKISGSYIIDMDKKEDERGFFARTWDKTLFSQHGLTIDLTQGNMSRSTYAGTLRGMHYQIAPYQESKLIRVVSGSIYDVIIDLRPTSPTYTQWIGVELSKENCRSLYVPEGCAHGFLTLTDDVEAVYWVTATYHPASERGVRYDDPTFGITWPMGIRHISEKDAHHPLYQKETL